MFNQTHKISENNTALTAALTTTFSNTKDTIIRVIIASLNNDKICTYLTKVIKSLKTVTSILIITFLNIKDKIIRVIMGLVKQ